MSSPMATYGMQEAIGNSQTNVELLLKLEQLQKAFHETLAEYQRNQEALSAFVPSISQTSTKATNGHSRPVAPTAAHGSKKDFVRHCFRLNPATNPSEINALWAKGGGEGTISPSLVYQTKGETVRQAAMTAPKRRGRPPGTDKRGRPPGTGKRGRPPGKRANAVADTGFATPTKIRRAILDLVAQQPMTATEIQMVLHKMFQPVPKNMEAVVSGTIKELRDNGKVERDENKRFLIAQEAAV